MEAARKKKVTKLTTEYTKHQEDKQQLLQQKRKRLIQRLAGFGVFVAVVSSIMVSSIISQSATIDEMLEEKAVMEKKLKELNKQEKVLREEIVKLNDEEYIAKIARRDYFLSEQGEIIFKLPESASSY